MERGVCVCGAGWGGILLQIHPPMPLSHGAPNPHHKWARTRIASPFSQQPVLSMAFNWLGIIFFFPLRYQIKPPHGTKAATIIIKLFADFVFCFLNPEKIHSHWLLNNEVEMFFWAGVGGGLVIVLFSFFWHYPNLHFFEWDSWPKIEISSIYFSTIHRCQLWWHFISHITMIEFHGGKEFQIKKRKHTKTVSISVTILLL